MNVKNIIMVLWFGGLCGGVLVLAACVFIHSEQEIIHGMFSNSIS